MDAFAERELPAARELLHRRNEPDGEAAVRLQHRDASIAHSRARRYGVPGHIEYPEIREKSSKGDFAPIAPPPEVRK